MHHVRRAHVPVHDGERFALLGRRLVCGVQPVEQRAHDGPRDAKGDALPPLAHRSHQMLQRLAVDVLHDEEQIPAVGDHV
jgi:hypothetical protein